MTSQCLPTTWAGALFRLPAWPASGRPCSARTSSRRWHIKNIKSHLFNGDWHAILINPVTPTVATWVSVRVPWCQKLQMTGLTRSGTGYFIATGTHMHMNGLDSIERCFTSRPTQYRLYGRRFLQVKRPNQQYQSTEGTNITQTKQTYNKRTWTQNTASPLVYNNMGWLGDDSYRGQGCQAWTAVGLPPRYPPPYAHASSAFV